ncbi:MAG: indole-3-glycerol-phosphate synthase [Gammaproteobacteria bacterium]
MSDFLASMAQSSKARSEKAQTICSAEQAMERCQDLPPTTRFKSSDGCMDVIAEIKVRSPAEGQLAEGVTTESIIARAADYVFGGASILSVLTEPDRFDGSLDYLAAVKAHVGKQAAVMRKDFLVDPYQLFEARIHGADGALLIARMLDDAELESMLNTANDLGLFVLLEAFDEVDLARMAPFASDQVLLGLNCRDLTTLKIDPARFERLAGHFPDSATKVAESGIHSVEEAAELHALGYDMALIGTLLMKTEHPATAISGIRDRTTRQGRV